MVVVCAEGEGGMPWVNMFCTGLLMHAKVKDVPMENTVTSTDHDTLLL